MAIESLETPPFQDNVLQGEPWKDTSRASIAGLLAHGFVNWLNILVQRFDNLPEMVAHASGTGQSAALAATPVLVTHADGLYRVGYSTKIEQAASTSSALQITIGFTRNGNACSVPGTVLAGNTVATIEGDDFDIRADADTAITVAINYVSVGATPMLYEYDVHVEAITN